MGRTRVHASTVAVEGRAVLITGAFGTGKSALALQLMAFGALLVADDQTELDDARGWPMASAPKSIAGLIEARGIGLLEAETVTNARLVLVIDLDHLEESRLPPERTVEILGYNIPCLHKVESPNFAAAILQYLKGGRVMR